MYNKKPYIAVACLIFLMAMIVFVSAVKPTVTVDGGLHIETTAPSYIRTGFDHEFETHVFNETTGYPITSGIDCYYHLYHKDGDHEAEVMMQYHHTLLIMLILLQVGILHQEGSIN